MEHPRNTPDRRPSSSGLASLALAALLATPLAAQAHGDAQAPGAARHPVPVNAAEAFGHTPLVSATLNGQWRLVSGKTAIAFNRELLRDLGILVTGAPDALNPRYVSFEIETPASLGFATPGGGLEGLDSIAISHRGDAALQFGQQRVSLNGFALGPHAGAGIVALRAASGELLFTLANAHVYRDALSGELYVMQMDLRLSAALAARIGAPEFAGQHVGVVDLAARIEPASPASTVEPQRGGCVADFGDERVDVQLTELDGIAELAREAGVRVALAPSAKLMNVGDNDIRWFWAIAPLGFNGPNLGSHPFLAMHYYRISDGVLEQIGRSELKHAWNTVNSNCPCAGGQVMFVGCEDTYGIGNNGNQFYFGPREELTAGTGSWTSLGSHFDAQPIDDFRDHGSEVGAHDAFEHRLVVAESDLQTPGAEYLIEAWYVVAGDTDIFNSMAYRRVTQTLIGNAWSFTFADASTTNGPAIDAWAEARITDGEARNTLIESGPGHLKLGVRTTDLGDGRHHYEYALMNLDFDARIERFSVPVLAGALVTDTGFGDVDDDPANDWAITVGSGSVTWTAPVGNALDWGTLHNFRFTADAAPADSAALLDVLEPGDPGHLAALTLAPVTLGATADADADGILDTADNCTLVANPDQRDTDGDFYGNACDADLNDDGAVNFSDLGQMKAAFFATGDRDEDLDGNGTVNFEDLGQMKAGFFAPPGPSGVAPVR